MSTLSSEGWRFVPAKEGATCLRGSTILTLPKVLESGAFVMYMNARSTDASRPRLWFKSRDDRDYDVWCATERPFEDMPRGFRRAYRNSSEDVVLTSDNALYRLSKRRESIRSGRIARFPSSHCNVLVFVKPVPRVAEDSRNRVGESRVYSASGRSDRLLEMTRSRSRERDDRLSRRIAALLPPSVSVSASALDPFRPPMRAPSTTSGSVYVSRGANASESVEDFIARHRRIREAAERRRWGS